MEFTKEKEIDGVLQRDFQVDVDGQQVPCVLWAPKDARGSRTLIVMGHGGSQHKKTINIRSRAIEYAQHSGWATVVADAPGHGDRISREDAVKLAEEVGARVTGRSTMSEADATARFRQMGERGKQAVKEWQQMLDAVQALDFI
ncbi:MAG: hypothetical protein WD558_04305, partial [Pseudomonadales bacterium]